MLKAYSLESAFDSDVSLIEVMAAAAVRGKIRTGLTGDVEYIFHDGSILSIEDGRPTAHSF